MSLFRRKAPAPEPDAKPRKKRGPRGLLESLVVGMIIGGAVGSIVGKNLVEEKRAKTKDKKTEPETTE
jgi:hypothetical protein